MAHQLSVFWVAFLLAAQGTFSQLVGTWTSLLRRISAAGLVIEANGKGIVTVSLASSTRHYGSAGIARHTDFRPAIE